MKKLAALTFFTLTLAGNAAAQNFAVTNVRVFDGAEVISEATVVVEEGVITAIGSDVEAHEGLEIVDGAGRTLLPGLIDAHVHTFYEAALQQNLVFGVTGVLDMFMDPGLAADLRAAQAEGAVTDRADLFSAGILATAPGGHGTQFGLEVDTLTAPEEAEDWVDARIAEGSDYIKVILETGEEFGQPVPTLDDATLRAVIAAAKDRDMLVVTHVQTLATARQALAAGTDGLAHMFTDAVADADFVAAAVEADLFVIPTLTVFQSIGSEGIDESISGDPDLAPFLSPMDLQNLAVPFAGYEGNSLDNALESVRLLHEAGIAILAGTDAMNPGTAYGASIHRELVLLTMAGLAPTEALASATSVPARIFELGNRGTIAAGAPADFLLVEGDPTAEIIDTRKIVGVWKGGIAADRASWSAEIAQQQGAVEQQSSLLAGGAPVLISDFETGGLDVAFGQPWVATTDMPAGGNSTAEISVADGGSDGSAYALEVVGEIGTDFAMPWGGVMFMPAAMPFAPADLSDLPVLTFDAAGMPEQFRVQIYCANLGQTIGEWPFDVTEDWQTFEVDLGTIDGCDPSGVMALIFTTGVPGPFSLMLDNVLVR